MGLGKTAATLALHLIHPPKTPSDGVPLDEKEWGPIAGKQVRLGVRARRFFSRRLGSLFSQRRTYRSRNTDPLFENLYFQVSDGLFTAYMASHLLMLIFRGPPRLYLKPPVRGYFLS